MRGATGLTLQCACHVKWLSWLILVAYETSFTMCGATGITLQPDQILRLPRKIAFQNLREIVRKQLKCQLQWRTISRMIRPWSEPDPSMSVRRAYFSPSATHFLLKITTFRAPAIDPDFTEYCACHKKWPSKITKYCACHEKWLSWCMDARHIWNLIYNARSNRHHPPTSPNTAPTTQNCIPKSKRNCPKTDEVSFT